MMSLLPPRKHEPGGVILLEGISHVRYNSHELSPSARHLLSATQWHGGISYVQNQATPSNVECRPTLLIDISGTTISHRLELPKSEGDIIDYYSTQRRQDPATSSNLDQVE